LQFSSSRASEIQCWQVQECSSVSSWCHNILKIVKMIVHDYFSVSSWPHDTLNTVKGQENNISRIHCLDSDLSFKPHHEDFNGKTVLICTLLVRTYISAARARLRRNPCQALPYPTTWLLNAPSCKARDTGPCHTQTSFATALPTP
jgi:hypothetical protein